MEVREIELDQDFIVTSIIHPETYLNKVVLGSEDGRLQLWNINSGKCVYTFKGWKSGVTCLALSPALDVIGIGLESGKFVVHNIKLDETIVTFSYEEGGPITSATFRSDNHPVLATGTYPTTILSSSSRLSNYPIN